MYNRYIPDPEGCDYRPCFDRQKGQPLSFLRSLLPDKLETADLILILILALLYLEDEDEQLLVILLFMLLG